MVFYMPIAVTVEGRLVTFRCTGSYRVDELFEAWDRVTCAVDFPAPAACVLDMRASDSVLVRPVVELRKIASFFTQRAEVVDRRVALVVEGKARYGLMRMAATWVELNGVQANVFRDLSEAQRWALSRLPDRPATAERR